MVKKDNRRDPRIPTHFETLYSAGRREGAGVLADISYRGALVDGASLKPPIGSVIRLYVFLQPVSPFELEGEVVRKSAGKQKDIASLLHFNLS